MVSPQTRWPSGWVIKKAGNKEHLHNSRDTPGEGGDARQKWEQSLANSRDVIIECAM
jgi:hypothetical protein